ncbi:uncharacterized protein LOC126819230 [Patella vulgata]|uniref:uncharacterized protein LOC126819230 n=1 Tax=Patella vulgata TaxID=6465 RepID=UPI00218039A6|nr:uncharacterized protein LOC126819230 [Patella vulgata]
MSENEILCSPPKLRRLVHLDKDIGILSTSTVLSCPDNHIQNLHQQDTCGVSSVNIESELIDSAIDQVVTLPQLVTNVSVAHKGQSNEISKHSQKLIQLEVQLQREEKLNSDILLDVSSVTKKVYITEDLVKEKQKSCQVLEKEIESIVTSNSQSEKKLDLKLTEIENEKRIYVEYRHKMEEHIENVGLFKESLPLNKQLDEQKHKVDTLQYKYNALCENKEKMRSVCSGEKDGIKEEIQLLQKKAETMRKDCISKQQQIEKVRQQELKVEQNINVLHKRNKAQLTRLKCQVKEQQLSYRQWSDQISHLKKILSDLKHQMGGAV